MIRRLGVLAILALYLPPSVTADSPTVVNDLLVQKTVFDLLRHCDQPDIVYPEIYKLGTSWDIEANSHLYKDQAVVKEFLQRREDGLLPRGRIFSIFSEPHREEAVALFDLFFSAGDIQTFLNTAAWARVHVNEYLFTYILYVTILQRNDTVKIRVPRPSEVEPWFYFNADFMQQVYDYKMRADPRNPNTEPVILYANYSSRSDSADPRDPETKLSYFREDVGLNDFYTYLHLEFPFWISAKKYNMSSAYRGELWGYLHKLLVLRYELEGRSHDLGKVEDFNWHRQIITGYRPALAYRNGLKFPERKERSNVPVHKYADLRRAEQLEARITEAIDSGHYVTPDGISDSIFDPDGLNDISNIIAGSADSPNRDYYGSFEQFARSIFGFSPEPRTKWRILPSVLDHYHTSMRDPAFYMISKRIESYLDQYKSHLPPYTRQKLSCDGVEIESVTIDKLETYFEWHDHSVWNSVNVYDHRDAESHVVKARQYRLNHKPFTFHITLKSAKPVNVTIRMFLGPKYNVHGEELDISENHVNFYQFECFVVELKEGMNKIDHKSVDASFMGPDHDSSDAYYKKVVDAIASGSELPLVDKLHTFPERLHLPKGTAKGLPVQFFFYVSKFDRESSFQMDSRLLGKWNFDKEAFGFPLDRPIFRHNFTGPNMLLKTVPIYHEDSIDL